MARQLTNTSDVIDALGGLHPVAKLTGRKYNAAANWRGSTKFPSNTYLIMTAALRVEGYTAPASLWGMTESELCETAGEGEV